MDKLKNYLANMTPSERDVFARRCDTSAAHLRNIAYGFRTANERLSTALERESAGALSRKDFFPKDWQMIWPELAREKVSA